MRSDRELFQAGRRRQLMVGGVGDLQGSGVLDVGVMQVRLWRCGAGEQLVPMLLQLLVALTYQDACAHGARVIGLCDAGAPDDGASPVELDQTLRHPAHEVPEAVAFDGAGWFGLVGHVRPCSSAARWTD